MFSIYIFKRPEDDPQFHVVENGPMKRRHDSSSDHDKSQNLSYEKTDLDLSNRRYAKTMKKLPDAIKHFTAKKCSLSDTDLTVNSEFSKIDRNCKKLKLDVEKANRSAREALDITCDNKYADDVIENTPKQISLGYSGNVFSEKFKQIDFNKSFDLFDYMSEGRPSSSDKDLETPWSERSDSELSASEDGVEVKMCKKVNDSEYASSVGSFVDLELDRNEEQRITLLLSYQMKLEKMEIMLKNLLTEFQFHIEVSKIFQFKSQVTTLPGTDISNIPKILGDIACYDSLSRNDSPTGSWNIVMKREDDLTKLKLKKQLLSMQKCIQEFMDQYLKENYDRKLNFNKGYTKKLRINRKKRDKQLDDCSDQCDCCCHKNNDSGLTTKSSLTENQTISSSIGNFSLDLSTLSTFSESLDNLSYSSFSDNSFFSTMLQKSAMERIMFYVQVHSIEMRNDLDDAELSTKTS
ncbi:hypothetical protein EVAR_86872_1 [Eumeta japonica]|uniref:Uncharacterized protein n=1 Tax=Eumeta variegata TaxID=151549 RepID=A0A4C1ZHJ0_EUMVA|nr:hypothetical protein EVAR_86872_1 [Eumeta japonica]